MTFEEWAEHARLTPAGKAIADTAWQAGQKALADELLDYAQHDSWRCGYYGECHCGLNTITERFGLPAIPLPEKGESK